MSATRPKQPTTKGDPTTAREQLAVLVEDIRSQVPADLTEEEIERDARQAIKEVRRRRHARRR